MKLYTRREQLINAHNILKKIFERHSDKRKVISKEELESIDAYLKTSRFVPNLDGGLKDMLWVRSGKKVKLKPN